MVLNLLSRSCWRHDQYATSYTLFYDEVQKPVPINKPARQRRFDAEHRHWILLPMANSSSDEDGAPYEAPFTFMTGPFPDSPEIDRMVIGISELKDTPRRCQY